MGDRLPLLSLLPATHQLITESVPPPLALRPDLVWIVALKIQGDKVTRYQLPIQWEPREAAALMHQIRGCSWQLADDGTPLDLETIHEVCEKYLKPKEFE